MKEFFAVSSDLGRNELRLFGEIGGSFFDDSFSEMDVAQMFEEINPNLPLEVSINSIGGSITSALAIKGMIERHPSAVTIRVTGLAASAATLITSAANARCIMSAGSLMMIHKPRCAVSGSPEEIKKTLAVLEKWAAAMEEIYCAKTHKSREEVAKIMQDETWYTAEEAVKAGFADEVDQFTLASASLTSDHRFLAIGGRTFDISTLNNVQTEKLMKITNPNDGQSPSAQIDPKAQAPLTADALLKAYPDQVAAIVKDALAKERERIQAIAELDDGSCPEIIASAMFSEPLSPEACALKVLKARRDKTQTAKTDLYQDGHALAAQLADMQFAAKTLPNDSSQERQELINGVQAAMKNILGY